MQPRDVTSREAVLKAIEEYDQLGQAQFLKRYGFGKSRKFSVVHDGREYDSKALLAAAHGFQYPDKGPLPNRFSGGEQTTSRFRAMGFEIKEPSTTPIDVKFTVSDCKLFAKYPNSVPWKDANISIEDQEHFKDIRERLKKLAEWINANARLDLPTKPFTSMHQANGRTQQLIWCCIFPSEISNKSYALQAALIISARGAEICLCLGAGRSQTKNRKSAELAFERLKQRLSSTPRTISSALAQALPEDAEPHTSWRRGTPAEPDFDSIEEWLRYASGPEGAQSSISVYLTPEELESIGTKVADRFLAIANASAPLFEYCYLEEAEELAVPVSFNVAELKRAAEESSARIHLDDGVYRAIIAAISSGKHIILTGPPGTAKTTLAEIVSQLAHSAQRCDGYTLTTATADWTTYETVGGLRPSKNQGILEFKEGLFLEAIRKNRWLIIDELNRSHFDRAFGQLFTILSKQAVVLPYEDGRGRPLALIPEEAAGQYPGSQYDVLSVPGTWRIIATMNVFDKSLLFEMSFALMRRFAFIEVPPPSRQVFADLWRQAIDYPDRQNSEIIEQTLQALYDVAAVKRLGPATFLDMARFAKEYLSASPATLDEQKELAFQLFYSYLLPQFEGVTLQDGKKLFRDVLGLVGEAHKDRLRTTLVHVLGLDFESASDVFEEDSATGI